MITDGKVSKNICTRRTKATVIMRRNLDESAKAVMDHSFCGNSFIRRRELHDFTSRSVSMTVDKICCDDDDDDE